MVDSGKQRIINRFNIKKKSKILVSGPITSWQIKGEKVETVIQFLFLGFKTTVDGGVVMKSKRHLLFGRKVVINLDSVLKSRNITLPSNVHTVKAVVFPSAMYGYESWATKKVEHQIWCFQIAVLEKTLESLLDNNEIKLVNPKGKQPWIFIGKTDAETESLIFWPPDAKSWIIGKDLEDWRQEEKGVTEDEMVEWHHWLNRRESDQTQGDSEEQGSLACCSPWDHKESDMTERLNNNNQ